MFRYILESMKAVLLNFGREEKVSSYMKQIEKDLDTDGVQCIFLNVPEIRGCTGCGKCWKKRRCVIEDAVNLCLDELEEADGMVIGSAVYYGCLDPVCQKFTARLYHAGSDRLNHLIVSAELYSRSAGTEEAFFALMENMARSKACIYVPEKFGRIEKYEKRRTDAYALLLSRHEQGRKKKEIIADPVICPFEDYVR